MVSTQPPWSTAISTITLPFRMDSTCWAETRCGVLAPGTSTAPISRSASATACATFSGNGYMVVTFAPTLRMDSSFWYFLSNTVTLAPRLAATSTALEPALPAPITTTWPLSVPGTPPRSRPLPPSDWNNRLMPWCTARRPAMSLMGARIGSPPVFCTVSKEIAVSPIANNRCNSSCPAAKCRKLNRICSGRSISSSCPIGSFTFTTSSACPYTELASDRISTPKDWYSLSE